jgi:hypothetical protein
LDGLAFARLHFQSASVAGQYFAQMAAPMLILGPVHKLIGIILKLKTVFN